MFIVFSGLDCAGKSTQINLLTEYLGEKEKTYQVIWSRGGYTKGMKWVKYILRKFSFNNIPKSGLSRERETQFNRIYIRKIWLFLSILDLMILYCFYFRLKSLTGVNVIADRYVEDTAIDFKINFPNEKVEAWLMWKFLEWFAPRPDKHYIALIPVKESLKRSKQKEEPFPDTEEVLKFRKELYENYIMDRHDIIQIDGTKNVSEIHNFILENLEF